MRLEGGKVAEHIAEIGYAMCLHAVHFQLFLDGSGNASVILHDQNPVHRLPQVCESILSHTVSFATCFVFGRKIDIVAAIAAKDIAQVD